MKTTVLYKDGRKTTHRGQAPSIDVDDVTAVMIDKESSVTSKEIDLTQIDRIIFEPESEVVLAPDPMTGGHEARTLFNDEDVVPGNRKKQKAKAKR